MDLVQTTLDGELVKILNITGSEKNTSIAYIDSSNNLKVKVKPVSWEDFGTTQSKSFGSSATNVSIPDSSFSSFSDLSEIPVSDRVLNKVYTIKHNEVKTPIEVIWDGNNFKGFRETVICNENRYDTYAIPFASATTTFTQIYTYINNSLGYFTIPANLIGYTSSSPFTKLRIKWFHNISNTSTSALEFSTRLYVNGFATSAYFPFSFPEAPISAGLASRYGYSEFFIDHNTNLAGDQNIRQTWRHSFGVYNYFADDNNSMIYDIFTTATPNLDYSIDNKFRFYTRIKNPAAQMSYGCRGLEVSILP